MYDQVVIVPTKRFWLVAAIGIIVAALAGLVGAAGLIALFDLILVVGALLTVLGAPKPEKISIRRDVSPVLSVRVSNLVKVEVTNNSRLPISILVRDEPDGSFNSVGNEARLLIHPSECESFAYRTTPPERGAFSFRATFVRVLCPLGLVERQYRYDTVQEAHVYPNVLQMKQFDLLNQRGRLREIGVRKSRMKGLGMEFESLRDYGVGDDYRKIDWKASARRGKFVVREYEVERSQNVVILIDCGRQMLGEADGATKLDAVLDASLMLSRAALSGGDHVGILSFRDRVIRYVPPRRSTGQLGLLISSIHDLLPYPVESDYDGAFAYLSRRWKRRSLIVVFTDASDPDRAKKLAAALSPLIRSHVVVLVQVDDPRMAELLVNPLDSASELYMRSAGLALAQERVEAASRLKAGRLHTVSAEPAELSKAIVSFYFQVKERALI